MNQFSGSHAGFARLALWALACGGAGFIGQVVIAKKSEAGRLGRGVPETVEAQQFVVRGADGKIRAVLGTSLETSIAGVQANQGLALMDEQGKTRAILCLGQGDGEGAATLVLTDSSGDAAAIVAVADTGEALIEVQGMGKNSVARIRIGEDGAVDLSMSSDGTPPASAAGSIMPRIALSTQSGERSVILGGCESFGVPSYGLCVNKVGQQNAGWINLSLTENAEGSLQVCSGKGKAGSFIFVSDGDRPNLTLMNSDYRTSTVIPK